MHSEPDYSDDIARTIDAEIRRLIEEAHQVARDILVEHRRELNELSEILLRRETIEREEFLELLAGRPEAEVFRARDERAKAALEDGSPSPEPAKRPRLPYPAAPGTPVPEG